MIGLGFWLRSDRLGTPTEPDPAILSVSTSGILEVGETITATVIDAGTGALSYVWERNGTPIAGATSSSYLIVEADAETELSVVVSKVGVVTPVEEIAGTVAAISGSGIGFMQIGTTFQVAA